MQSWYWDLNEQTRAFAKRFFARRQRMPNNNQVALYSSVRHYLEAVARAGTDEAQAVVKAMREANIHDIFTMTRRDSRRRTGALRPVSDAGEDAGEIEIPVGLSGGRRQIPAADGPAAGRGGCTLAAP